jgi:DNA phosphorothioation-dependent restriction protein DptG
MKKLFVQFYLLLFVCFLVMTMLAWSINLPLNAPDGSRWTI